MQLSNSQTELADRVRLVLEESAAAEVTAIEKAMEAGRLLCEAKESCAHGTWLPFLEHSGVPERKAQRYMRLARSGLKSDTVSDLGGITAALHWCENKEASPGESLDELAKIAIPFMRAEASGREAEDSYLRLGQWLTATKDTMTNSEWLSWLKVNEEVLGFGVEQANRFMREARSGGPRLTSRR